MVSDTRKILPVADVLTQSFQYFRKKPQLVAIFSVLNYFITLAGIYTWSTPVFFAVLIIGYAFWSYFFRFYFDKKPYFQTKSMTSSLAPSVKILVIGFVVLTILIVLPFVPLFLGVLGTHADAYLAFLKKYMQDTPTLDMAMGLIMIFVAPFLFFRPFFAWIGSLLGRNGNIKYAMQETQGNYWQFVMLVLILNIPFAMVEQLVRFGAFPQIIGWAFMAPMVVYVNIAIAECYKFFFMDD